VKHYQTVGLEDLPSQLWKKVSLYPHNQSITSITAGPSFTFIYDGQEARLLYASPEATHILGWSQEALSNRSLRSILHKCHTEDLRSVLVALCKANRYLRERNQEEKDSLKFLLDFRLKVATGNYVRILLQAILRAEPHAKHDYWMGTVSNISYLKREGTVSFLFQSRHKQIKLSDITTNHKNFRLFSSRERDVLRLLARGYSTQKIENTLHISQHTVRTHRRNMHKKCKVKNTAQLINLAIREGYI